MNILFATQHFFAPNYRMAGMHQMAGALARRCHHIDFITVGQSWLKQRMKPSIRAFAEAAASAARDGSNPKNITAHVHREWIHPPSGSPLVNRLTVPLDRRYGNSVDRVFGKAAQSADVMVLECGPALYFFEALKRLNPRAKFVAFYMDRLELVGFRREIIARHERLMPLFDLVRTNSERLLDYLPKGATGRYVPQGVDKARMRFDVPTPYEPGSRNIVSVGDMLFDEAAVRAIAASSARCGAHLHVIGAGMSDPPPNLTVHGELPFEGTLPYLVHADVGLAPYRLAEGADYLVQSSLKIQQYSYCGLPVLLARGLNVRGDNFIYYDPSDPQDVANAVSRALAIPKDRSYGSATMDWDEVAELFENLLRELGAERRR